MSRLTSAQVIALGEYLEPTFDPASLTVSQLLGVLGYHNVNYPTPYSKSKLAMIFNQEIKAKATQLKKERVKKENSIASDDGILDGATGQPLRKACLPNFCNTSLLADPISGGYETEVQLPYQPKRRRSSAQPTLGGSSRKSVTAQLASPTLVEESEAEDLPIPKVSRSKKTARAQSRRVSNTPAEDSGWEDNNIFQSGAESSSPARPSPIRPKSTRKSVPGSRKSRQSSSSVPLPSPSQALDNPNERMSPLLPPQFKFEPNLPSIFPIDQSRSGQLQRTKSTPSKSRISVFEVGHEDDRDKFDIISGDFSLSKQTESLNRNAYDVSEDQDVESEEVDHSAVTQDEQPCQGVTRRRIVLTGFIFLLVLIGLSATISYKMDSASIGYCDSGSDTNSVLEQRRAERAAVEACNRANGTLHLNNHSVALDNTTSCPIPSLNLWGYPDKCTPCPNHANCTPDSVLCDHGYVLRSHPLLFFIPASLSPRNTTISVSSGSVDLLWSMLSILDGFPGLGSVAFPPRCIEDPERKRKIGSLGKAIESFLGRERGRRLCVGGKALLEPIEHSDGGDAKKWGLELENLREMMQKKTHPQLLPSFDDMFDEAIQQLTQWGGVILGKDRTAHRRAENKRVTDLVQIALDTLRNQEFSHHTDPVTTPQPYLSSLQLRDLILQDEHSVTLRSRLWDQVERIVEGNANVRANFQETQGGDEMRVWRWVGSSRGTNVAS
ncbi:hypothetical protein C0993_011557 [Termitomyces sp. T159_Od127]|nr:hypothetical protein C0993_011557 [Termitomyces sp. T159_Od127]